MKIKKGAIGKLHISNERSDREDKLDLAIILNVKERRGNKEILVYWVYECKRETYYFSQAISMKSMVLNQETRLTLKEIYQNYCLTVAVEKEEEKLQEKIHNLMPKYRKILKKEKELGDSLGTITQSKINEAIEASVYADFNENIMGGLVLERINEVNTISIMLHASTHNYMNNSDDRYVHVEYDGSMHICDGDNVQDKLLEDYAPRISPHLFIPEKKMKHISLNKKHEEMNLSDKGSYFYVLELTFEIAKDAEWSSVKKELMVLLSLSKKIYDSFPEVLTLNQGRRESV